MSQLSDIDQFIDASRCAQTPRDLERLIDAISRDMGFDHYALMHHVDLSRMDSSLKHMDSGDYVALHNYPAGWTEEYLSRNIYTDDPILIASERSAVGFRWSDAPKLVAFTPAYVQLTEDSHRGGLGDGFTVPAHVPGEANGSCSFAVAHGRRLPDANLLMAQLVGSFAFQAARSMVHRARALTDPSCTIKLTGRQLECIALVAQGKTDWEIARILGIGEETVRYHIKAARERYGVPTRIQAAFRAVYQGQISLADILR